MFLHHLNRFISQNRFQSELCALVSIKTVLNQLPNIVIHQIQTQIDQNGYKKAPYQKSLCHFSSVHRNLFKIKSGIYF